MALKVFKPVTPGQRFKSVLDYSVLTKKEPERNLLEPLKKTGGRSHGKVAVRGRGGGAKRLYRIIDFKRDKLDLPAKVEAIEYDPNRTVNIALLTYQDGEKRYILAPEGLKVGEEVLAGENVEIKIGNATSLKNIPVGTPINNVELVPGRGGQIAKSAGSSAMISAKEGKFAHVKLPSGELRKINLSCLATIGQLSNVDWKNVKLGKAGRKRYLGRRPKVRGVAMDPGSHPHGGGEGRSGIGMPSPKSPWGWRTLGRKTRKPGKPSDKFILERRK